MEFIQVGERAYCLAGATNIGVLVAPNGDAVVIDSGLDASSARRTVREVAARGWRVAALFNTHAHADHIGGDAEMKRRTACVVLAPPFEEAWVRNPIMEPMALFGGANPPDGLRAKFTMAEPCAVDAVIGPGPVDLCGVHVEVVDLRGHSPGQVGVLCSGAFFCGDAFFKAEQLQKHVIPYNVDIGSHLETLRRVASIPADAVIPGHGGVSEDPRADVDANLARIEAVSAAVLECISTLGPMGSEAVTEAVCRLLGVAPSSAGHYHLLVSAVNAYLSYLEARGLVQPVLDGAALKWRRTGERR